MKTYEINKNERTPDVIDSLTCVWEESVRASHTFLTESDIANLKPFIREAWPALRAWLWRTTATHTWPSSAYKAIK